MNSTIKQAIEDRYCYLENNNDDTAIRENNQRRYDQRKAAEYCYSLVEQEIERLELIIHDQKIGIDMQKQGIENLEQEITRLKELIEKAHKDGYPDHVTERFKEAMWQQFKTNNQL